MRSSIAGRTELGFRGWLVGRHKQTILLTVVVASLMVSCGTPIAWPGSNSTDGCGAMAGCSPLTLTGKQLLAASRRDAVGAPSFRVSVSFRLLSCCICYENAATGRSWCSHKPTSIDSYAFVAQISHHPAWREQLVGTDLGRPIREVYDGRRGYVEQNSRAHCGPTATTPIRFLESGRLTLE